MERLEAAVGDRVLAFEHVGSTAVEGLPAKPIIDILGIVPNLEEADGLVAALESSGYEHRPDDIEGRHFLAKGPASNRTHYLSLATRESAVVENQLAFRDALRTDPALAQAYADRKRTLTARYPDDRATYTAKKGAFVRAVLKDVAKE
ncbi:GrpB family protein [Natrialbaceae archaeon A-chndr2]